MGIVYYYKFNKTNGETYVQVWRKTPEGQKDEYVGSLGSAKKAAKILVALKELKIQTKKLAEIKTKILEEDAMDYDQ